MGSPTYIAIDLKSFYASVECTERQLNPLTTNLVVADSQRTEKTICLAVSPSLKSYGIHGRARLFEVVQRVKEVNLERKSKAPGRQFTGSSYSATELAAHPELELSYITAPPRMAFYLEYSTIIYNIYLKYIAPEDIHVYSIDEVFMDVTHYLKTYAVTPRELASRIILDVLDSTGITATAGIGTTVLSQISGEWDTDTGKNWKPPGFSPWGISRAALWVRTGITTMRSFCIRCSASTRSC